MSTLILEHRGSYTHRELALILISLRDTWVTRPGTYECHDLMPRFYGGRGDRHDLPVPHTVVSTTGRRTLDEGASQEALEAHLRHVWYEAQEWGAYVVAPVHDGHRRVANWILRAGGAGWAAELRQGEWLLA